jgi:CRISPR-associated protein Csa3
MAIMIATLGGSEDIIKLGVKLMENVNTVLIVAGKPLNEIYPESEIKKGTEIIKPLEIASELEKLLEGFGIKAKTYKVNPFDFKECLVEIIELIYAQPENAEVVLNVTGGTKILSLAAMSAACMCGRRAFVVQEKESGDIKIELPMPDSGYFANIGKQGKKILSYLMQEEKKLKKPNEQCDDEKLKPFITKNISNHLGVTPQTITPNLKTLEFSKLLSSRKGAVKRGEPSGGKCGVKIWRLTDEGKVYAAFFGKEKV